MASITRTVMSGLEYPTYVSVDSISVVPMCITRYSAGTRVEIRKVREKTYAVKAVPNDPLHVFGEETWLATV